MLTRLFGLAVLPALAAGQINITTPSGTTSAVQCQVYHITWITGILGSSSPWDVRLLTYTGGFVEEIANSATKSPVEWTVNQPANPGQLLKFSIADSIGTKGDSGPFTIQPSSNSTCLSSVVISTTKSSSTGQASTSTAIMSTPSLPSTTVSTAPPVTSSASQSSSKTLSAGAIAGIAVGAACGGLIVLLGVVWTLRHSSRSASSLSDAPLQAVTNVVTSVEPFPLTWPGVRRLGRSGIRSSSTLADWERKNRQNNGPSTAEEHTAESVLEGTVRPGLSPTVSAEAAPLGNVELSETSLDRLVNQVLRRLQAQEAPPSYPASSHPGSES